MCLVVLVDCVSCIVPLSYGRNHQFLHFIASSSRRSNGKKLMTEEVFLSLSSNTGVLESQSDRSQSDF